MVYSGCQQKSRNYCERDVLFYDFILVPSLIFSAITFGKGILDR